MSIFHTEYINHQELSGLTMYVHADGSFHFRAIKEVTGP